MSVLQNKRPVRLKKLRTFSRILRLKPKKRASFNNIYTFETAKIILMELTKGTIIQHDRYGIGIVSKANLTSYEIFFETKGRMEISRNNTDYKVVEKSDEPEDTKKLSLKEVEKVFDYLMDKYGMLSPELPIGDKWNGGNMILQPSNPDLKPKEIPIEVFFHKIVMLRDNIRVMEQKINSHPAFSEEDKIQMQQYITKMYGSLTTFNILFADKDDYFKGAGK